MNETAVLFNQYRMFYGQPSDWQGAKDFLFERFAHHDSVLFIAVDGENNHVVGFTQLYPSYSSVSMKRVWILNDLYVLENYRTRGAGQLLLDEAKHYACLTGAKGIELATSQTNGKAKRLYEKNGYQRDNEFDHYFLSF